MIDRELGWLGGLVSIWIELIDQYREERETLWKDIVCVWGVGKVCVLFFFFFFFFFFLPHGYRLLSFLALPSPLLSPPPLLLLLLLSLFILLTLVFPHSSLFSFSFLLLSLFHPPFPPSFLPSHHPSSLPSLPGHSRGGQTEATVARGSHFEVEFLLTQVLQHYFLVGTQSRR